MDSQKLQTTWGAMLHDIGKVILRAGAGEQRKRHSVLGAEELIKIIPETAFPEELLACVRYHHARELANANLPENHVAFLVCEADNISSGTDRRERLEEGTTNESAGMFVPSKCLDSVYNLVRTARCNKDTNDVFPLQDMKKEDITFVAPISSERPSTVGDYQKIWDGIQHGLKLIDWQDEAYLNSVYSLLEAYLSYVPSSTAKDEVADISLFDHSSLTAAMAACMLDWAREKSISNYKDVFFTNKDAFRNQKAFLLVHADVSGIQEFIYTISSKGALKSLRARSFYLEIMLEQIADEILSALNLSRANLLYSGGGGFYMLLPNTKEAEHILSITLEKVNQWLLEQFSIRLFLALGWAAASANDFMYSEKSESTGTKEIFREVSRKVSVQKMQRYTNMDLHRLFTPQKPSDGARECTVCGCSQKLSQVSLANDDTNNALLMCESCKGLLELGRKLARSERRSENEAQDVFCVQKKKPFAKSDICLQLPSLQDEAWLTLRSDSQMKDLRQRKEGQITRVYSKNHRSTGLDVSTHIFVGDYCFSENCELGEAVEMKDFVTGKTGGDGKGEGISRVAVLRADVDNLGNLFAGGFRGITNDKQKYETLGRYATLSRSLSRFFKSHINHIAESKKRNMLLVYAGGDDVFAVGNWEDILEFAVDLRESFRSFTSDKLSFSAGIGFFQCGFPISRMAEITGDLEDAAKQGSKDQIALFGLDFENAKTTCKHVYSWERYQNEVLPKKKFLVEQLHLSDSDQAIFGKAFLYKMYSLLLSADKASDGKISLARLAYLIARRDPGSRAQESEQKNYLELRSKLYDWSIDEKTRQELITAIMLSAYETRERRE